MRDLLSGGDRRSQAMSHLALARVRDDPRRVRELAALVDDEDWLVSMRALDLLEKLAHENPAWVEPHKRVFLGDAAASDKWEILLQVMRALPLFRWTPAERRRAIRVLRRGVAFPQSFVQAWALDGLATLAGKDAALRREVTRSLAAFERSGKKSLEARARHIRARLAEQAPRPRARKTR
jgi:hypothetical protein